MTSPFKKTMTVKYLVENISTNDFPSLCMTNILFNLITRTIVRLVCVLIKNMIDNEGIYTNASGKVPTLKSATPCCGVTKKI